MWLVAGQRTDIQEGKQVVPKPKKAAKLVKKWMRAADEKMKSYTVWTGRR